MNATPQMAGIRVRSADLIVARRGDARVMRDGEIFS